MKYFVFLLLLGFVIGCSDGLVDFESEDVEGHVSDTTLYVYNKRQANIWYFVVERETVAYLSWVAKSSEENAIQPGKTQNISLKEVYGYEKGDEIIFYYWSVKEPESEDIRSFVIKTD